MSPGDRENVYKVKVEETCKFDKSKMGADGTVRVHSAANSAMCGVTNLNVGSSYTFFANDNMNIGMCTWNGEADWGETQKLCNSSPEVVDPGCICTKVFSPVCCSDTSGTKVTFSNSCEAKCAGAAWLHDGPCGDVVSPGLPPRNFPGGGNQDVPRNGGINPHAGVSLFPVHTNQDIPRNGGINPQAGIPNHIPHYPPMQPYMMTMKDAELEICSLCDRLRGSRDAPLPVLRPMPVGPFPSQPAVNPNPMPVAPLPEQPTVRPIHTNPPVIEESVCMCPMMYAPVCGQKNGVQKTYGNQCQAGCERAMVLHDGQCESELSAEIAVEPVSIAARPQ